LFRCGAVRVTHVLTLPPRPSESEAPLPTFSIICQVRKVLRETHPSSD
jgi:hypothetical protein